MAALAMGTPTDGRHPSHMDNRIESARGAERLRAYHVAVELADRVHEVASRGRCTSWRRDQLIRSSESAVLNTVEGAGHYQPGKKIYHYELAKGSAEECKAALRLLRRRDGRVDVREAIRTVDTLCALLIALIKSQEKRCR